MRLRGSRSRYNRVLDATTDLVTHEGRIPHWDETTYLTNYSRYFHNIITLFHHITHCMIVNVDTVFYFLGLVFSSFLFIVYVILFRIHVNC